MVSYRYKTLDSLIPYTTPSNDIKHFLGVPTREEVVGQRFSHLSTMYIGSKIKRRVYVTSGHIIRQNLPRGSRDLDFPACFLLIGCDNLVEGLGTG